MKIKDLKTMPDDADVMMYVNKMLPVSVVQFGTMETLEPTGKKLFGMPVVGGEKKPIVILASTETDSTKNDAVNQILSGISALNMLQDGNDYNIENVKKWVSHSQEHFNSAIRILN
jgi:hypothetical protein